MEQCAATSSLDARDRLRSVLEELQCGPVVQQVPGAASRRRVRAVERGQQADRLEGAAEDARESERTQEAGEQRLRLNLCAQTTLAWGNIVVNENSTLVFKTNCCFCS